MGGAGWTKEEKVLCLECKSRVEFYTRYIAKFGPPSRGTRIDNIWRVRNAIRDELMPVKPGVSQLTTPQGVKGRENLPDVGEVLVGISNKLSELIALEKEQLALFQVLKKPAVTDETGRNDHG